MVYDIEQQLQTETDKKRLLELYRVYRQVLCKASRDDFASFNKYLEIDEDINNVNRKFYGRRKNHIFEIIEALNDMEIHDKYDTLIISCPPRVGKEQPLHSKVLTPNGWSTMGDMRVGSTITGHDGKPYNVTGVFPQGVKDVYNVTFDDDTSAECGLEHLWTVQTRDGKERTVTTGDMMKNLYVECGKRKNYSVQYVEPVQFNDTLSSDDLHPYLLGASIGDGGLKQDIRFTTTDIDLSEYLQDTDKIHRIGDTISFNIVKKDDIRNERGYPIKSHTHRKLNDYGLFGCGSHDKFIPKQYLHTTVENRVELLRGLMDTDGSVSQGSYCEYTTVSKMLCDDMVELLRGLGARVTVSNKMGKIGNKEYSMVYRIVFNISSVNPFKLERKASRFKPRTTRTVKYIKSIEYVGKSECQCIMVDNPKHLYVTDGYNVTHNTTLGIRFLAWICGRHPDFTEFATSYSGNITTSFYIGVLEVLNHERYIEVFPEAPVVQQNAKREEIWVKAFKRYPTITFVSVDGSMTGRAEAGKYLYCDDLVSGIEEAMSVTRLESLWQKYAVNLRQRKIDGCKEIHICTRWSVHDVATRLENMMADNPRCKVIKLKALNEDGESNFDFVGGFTKEFYLDHKNTMDEMSFNAIYQQEPIEREGLLYHKDDMRYYISLPEEKPDTVVGVTDSKGMGKDYVCSIVGNMYGNDVYITDVVYDNRLPEITRPRVARMCVDNGVVRMDIELNNGGDYYAEDVGELIKSYGGKTSISVFYTSTNKITKIITYSDYVIKNFLFKHPSTYTENSDYGRFMTDVFKFTQVGKNKNDDSVDALAMLSQMVQELSFGTVKILSRRVLNV